MPGFVEGALANAIRVQADPNAAAMASAKAFGTSGELALKLTALLDNAEAQRQEQVLKLNTQILDAQQVAEVGRHNLETEAVALQNANTSSKLANIRIEELAFKKDKFNEEQKMSKDEQSAKIKAAAMDEQSLIKDENILNQVKSEFELSKAKHEEFNSVITPQIEEASDSIAYSKELIAGLGQAVDPESVRKREEYQKSIIENNEKLATLKREKRNAERTLYKQEQEYQRVLNNQTKTIKEYTSQNKKTIKDIAEDSTLTPIEKLTMIAELQKRSSTKVSQELKEIDSNKKISREDSKADKKLARDIILETEKSKNKIVENQQKAKDKILELKKTQEYKSMSAEKKLALDSYLKEKTQGFWDSIFSNQVDILSDFNKQWEEKFAKRGRRG